MISLSKKAWPSDRQSVLCLHQMFERETKREKILEARHREIRLKERSRSEQSKEEDTNREADGEESPEELIARAEAEFFEMIDSEMKRREKEEEKLRVSIITNFKLYSLISSYLMYLSGETQGQSIIAVTNAYKYLIFILLSYVYITFEIDSLSILSIWLVDFHPDLEIEKHFAMKSVSYPVY